MSLSIYNTLTRRKELFAPLQPDRATMYVCGPTVYGPAHIGNARPVVVFDTLFRVLQTLYDEVTYARNITDVDDKIIAAARERAGAATCGDKAALDSPELGGESRGNDDESGGGADSRLGGNDGGGAGAVGGAGGGVGRSDASVAVADINQLAADFTQQYRDDMAALNALPPTVEPAATAHIPQMIALTETLLAKDHAYEAEGHVLFKVQSMPDYGKLSNRALDDMLAGARVEVADYKRYPGDFVLWKPAANDEPGWNSPWGRGRPGWHLECSAMARAHLGDTIDIHGGGQDLIFPHHENEIAQSRCAYGGDYARYWMHNAYIDLDGEKMSKSLGNVRTVRDLLAHYPGEVLRFALLSAHYRSPLDFSAELLQQSRAALDSLYLALRETRHIELDMEVPLRDEAFHGALCDDLNTPAAIAELHNLARRLRGVRAGAKRGAGSGAGTERGSGAKRGAGAGAADKPALKARLLAGADLLGILQQDPEAWFQAAADDAIPAERVEALIQERDQAKQNKDYPRADAIRAELEAEGVLLEDSRDGTTWRRG